MSRRNACLSAARTLTLLTVVILIGTAPAGTAGQGHTPLIVSADWLRQHHRAADLVLLHVGDRAGYDAEHIPGARLITLDDVSAPRPAAAARGEILELGTPESARTKLELLGIGDASHIVVYFGKDWVSPATRIVFALDWLGLGSRVSFLDGGLPAWKRAGGTVTADLPQVVPGKLSAKPTRDVTVTRQWVQENRDRSGIALIDARAATYYDGIESGSNGRGHIPGARNIPYHSLLAEDSRLKSRAQLQQIFTSAGIKPGDTVVAYCHIGQQATVVLLAARELGYKTLLYDGSFHDWAKHNLPVARRR